VPLASPIDLRFGATASADAEEGGPPAAPDHLAGRNNLQQLIQLRWLAVAGQLATILTVHAGLRIPLPLREMLALLALLAMFNVACWLQARRPRRVHDAELFAGLVVDVGILAGQLYYAGGVTNPFIFLFLLQVVVGAVLLRRGYRWGIVALTGLAFIALTAWHRPLVLPHDQGTELSVDYIGGLLICFVLDAALLVIFIDRITRNLRQRDARLAELRQRAAEEEHILRMGLLASGAAHELGTPLATLSVILGDWARMAPFAAEPELREEIEEMETQVKRCKAIVTSILMSAGETRGDSPVLTTLHAFLDELVGQWQRTRPAIDLHYERHVQHDADIISDTALKQMIFNVLDNAADAAPQGLLRFVIDEQDGRLQLLVQDRGPGFQPQMLERFGKPYQSSKGRPGGGLGLFLSVNVARTLGGQIVARNRPEGGAEVRITLPLAALRPRARLASRTFRHGRS
jgi:two-component system sensor histidine kinase RegB